MPTAADEIVAIVRANPGAMNPFIRERLRVLGYSHFTKKSLNQLLYSMAPDRLNWSALPTGKRAWFEAGSMSVPTDEASGELILSTSGARFKG